MADWRLLQLQADPLLNPGKYAAIAGRTWWRGYVVDRPGVPNWHARRSVHLTRRRAAAVVKAWNEVVIAFNEVNEPYRSLGCICSPVKPPLLTCPIHGVRESA